MLRASTDESVGAWRARRGPRRRRAQKGSQLKVAAVQLNSSAEKDANMAAADRLVRAAVGAGARLVVLPEKWTAIGTNEQMRAAAETLEGPAIAWARAARGGAWHRARRGLDPRAAAGERSAG